MSEAETHIIFLPLGELPLCRYGIYLQVGGAWGAAVGTYLPPS